VLAKTRNGYASTRQNYKAQLVIERLTNQQQDSYTSPAMQWGTEWEDAAKLAYMLKTGNTVTDTGFLEHPAMPAGASPDGLVGDDGLIEIKCPLSANHIETLHGGMPKKHIPQIQGQMFITGRQWCDFISYDPRMPENAQLYIERIERDDEYIENLEDELASFLDEVEEDVAFIKDYK
jgi:putative phage-type endonuclease